ncbi:M20 family metallopeptidase [Solicola gregarius]|uniref:Probable succinyl-diaminopimelate desuccinylase n=1 Tax=Solicola gregarius TaxID=2908642 RepID=A0AA46TEV0_9ACTN|nr:M20 family metallopeptidase [Solicola gregarius]UYM03786.1 M20 family metallopeptidase [Solicola gregarius]
MTGDLTPAEREVLDRITVGEVAALTSALVAAPGQNPPGGEAETAAVLADACRTRGLSVEVDEVEPGRPNVSATLAGGSEPGLLLLGHTDVVPVGDGWTLDPVGGEVRDGRLYGRGSTDMKGGLAASVVAMAALRTAGISLAGPVELAAVMDEEETGKGVRRYIERGGGAGYGGCIVAEPTDLQPIIAARGDSYIEIAVSGHAAHSGNPADGVNAIYGAAAIVADLEAWHHELAAGDSHPLVGPPTWNVGRVDGGLGTSTVPAECHLMVDRRLLPTEEGAPVLAATRERIAALGLDSRGLGVEIAMTMEMPGFETPAEHGFVAAVDGALGAAGGPGLPLAGWTAACDGGFIARAYGTPVVVLGPGSVGTQAHQPDESVGLDELVVAARTYALAAMRLLSA